MGLADQLKKIKTYKENIRQAIISKGVTVSESTPLSQYPSKIQQITTTEGNTGTSDDYSASDIRRQVTINGVTGTMDEIKRVNTAVYNNEYYGCQVADVAKSYYWSMKTGDANYQYEQNSNIYGSSGYVTNSAGHCCIDCSGFVGLVLRGIPYNKSPFYNATGTANKTWSRSSLATLCKNSEYVWADDYLDMQPEGVYNNFDIAGYSSIRNAAQQAQYYYAGKGQIIREWKEYETEPSVADYEDFVKDLQPGDLVFWSKSGASDNQKKRFKGISHVGIVARDTKRFYQVTGSEDSKGQTMFYSYFYKLKSDGVTVQYNNLAYISLIIRPNYTRVEPPKVPLGENLLPVYDYYGRDDMAPDNTVERYGVTFTALSTGGFTLSGTATTGPTFYITRKAEEDLITLTPGTYELSGCPAYTHKDVTLISWGVSFKDINDNTFKDVNGDRAWCAGSKCTFKITEEVKVYFYFYMYDGLKASDHGTIKPKLVKKS